MGNDPTETKQEESVWQVQLGEAACMMTRRELDAALAREDIDPYTLVREPGTLRWLSLGTIRGIESETMNLKSQDVEIVPSDYTPSFVAPRPVPIETERARPPAALTKEERALVRPRGLFLPQLVLVGLAVFGGVFLAQHYLPSLSSATRLARAHANASSTQTSVAGITSLAPTSLAPTSLASPTTVAPPPAAPAAPSPPATGTPMAAASPDRRALLAAKPHATPAPARATSSVRPAGATAKKAAPATTRSGAKAKPAPTKAAPKPAPKAAPKRVASKPTTPARTAQPLKPDPPRPNRPTR